MIISARFFFAVLVVLTAVAASLGFIHNVNIPDWVDGIRIKTYLSLIAVLFILLISVFLWWIVYLPSPERWYLACARTCLFLLVGSGVAIVGDLGIKFFTAEVSKTMVIAGAFQDQGYERIGVFTLSVIFLDVFSKKYAKYR